ncbi:MAG: Hsp70 family protein, partial [bacterium]
RDDEIKRMVKEAEIHAEEDKKKRELQEAKNHADNIVYSTEKALREYGDKVSVDEKKKIEDAISNVKEKIKGNDKEAIEKAVDELLRTSQKLGEAVYKEAQAKAEKQQTQTGTQSEAPKEEKKEDVIEGEYKVEE